MEGESWSKVFERIIVALEERVRESDKKAARSRKMARAV